MRYLFTIENRETGGEIYPIGSSCIKLFNRKVLDMSTAYLIDKHKLTKAINTGKFLEFTTEYFSRRLLENLYDEGCFQDSQYNKWDGRNDYDFLLKMFNKRNKYDITEPQRRKIIAILLNTIKPFLLDTKGVRLK